MSNNYWYYIFTNPNNGAFNMSCDNYFFSRSVENKLDYPMLRLYGWLEPTLSLGANQLFPDQKIISTFGKTNVVRRLTGGQAVFHDTKDNEITYSVVMRCNLGFRKIYNLISSALVQFIQSYDLNPKVGYSNSEYFNNFNCFDSKTEADIIVNGDKIIGSAQYRKNMCILQHGTIKLNLISKKTKKKINFEEGLTKLKSSFQEALNITFLDYVLTNQDYERINNISRSLEKCIVQT